jgi:hypothetical protein
MTYKLLVTTCSIQLRGEACQRNLAGTVHQRETEKCLTGMIMVMVRRQKGCHLKGHISTGQAFASAYTRFTYVDTFFFHEV